MSSIPVLTEFDQLAIMQSFGAACGTTALLVAIEDFEPETQREIKEKVITQWRGAWMDVFRDRMFTYNESLSKMTNSHKIAGPEDFQQAFNGALRAAEKTARISLRLEEAK